MFVLLLLSMFIIYFTDCYYSSAFMDVSVLFIFIHKLQFVGWKVIDIANYYYHIALFIVYVLSFGYR